MVLTADGVKGLALAILIIVSVIGAIVLPLFLKHKAINCVFGEAMSAGVMLTAAVVHLLPEAVEELAKAKSLGAEKAGIVAGIICVSTYVVFVLLEEIATHLLMKEHDTESPIKELEAEEAQELESGTTDGTLTPPPLIAVKSHTLETVQSGHCHIGHSHSGTNNEAKDSAMLSVSGVCLFVALGMHSIVEGFAMGAPTEIKQVWMLLVSIGAHKGLEAFALGQTLLAAKYGKVAFGIMVVTFVLFSPLGLCIGWGCSQYWDGSGVGIGVTNAIAGGTFLSVSTFELLPRVFRESGRLPEKTFGLIIGVVALALIIYLMHYHEDGPDGHAHPGGHSHH
eukprot:GEMP01015037.1.p1 GENE.GEMP01015037.1~~GEMP01015037.1.p1  ORF type:complete len:338 (+),score=72.51 GEMP01015037.1:1547-2560(+)